LAVSVSVQVEVPVQAPVQPANIDPEAAVAVSVTCVPLGKFALQVPGQLMPEGLLVTVPAPEPVVVTVSWTGGTVDVSNSAFTVVLAVSVRVQVDVPVQAPVQPAKVDPEAAVAVSITCVPLGKLALQVPGQLMPDGLLVTVPVPVPVVVTVSWTGGVVEMSKLAVTEVAALRVTTQVVVPVQAPDHPANVDPDAAVAVSVTCVPLAKFEVHVPGQLMPEGSLVTVPEPEPDVVTVSGTGAAAWSKVAVMEVSAPSVTTQLDVPLHAPDQPVKVDAESGVAVSVSCIPPEKLALQVDPQVMPFGLLETVPPPDPAFCTEIWKVTFLWPLTEAHPATKHTNARKERLKTALSLTMDSPEYPGSF